MKRSILTAAVLLGSSSAAFAAAPDQVASLAMSCCDLVLACCDVAMSCCP
jgi:mevalonate pyrophosphate decarboxylase